MNRQGNGGSPSKEEKQLQEKLQKLDLFSRESEVYRNIEKEMAHVSPARAFYLFCNCCARRDILPVENPEGSEYLSFVHNKRMREYQNRLQQLQYVSNTGDIPSLERLQKLSENMFMMYMDFFYLDYVHNTSRNSEADNYRFRITASILLGSIFHFYTEEQQEAIISHITEEHIKTNPPIDTIYKNCSDTASLNELQKIFILEQYRVSIDDVTNNIESPFYMKDRTYMEGFLYRSRYKDIHYLASELPSKNPGRPLGYKPNVNILINMDHPDQYIQEMLYTIKDDWIEVAHSLNVPSLDIDADTLQKLREEVTSFNHNKKTLSGKLADMIYIYDMKRFGFTNTFIIDNISHYMNKKKHKRAKKEYLSTSSLHKYHKLTRTMIEQRYYKHF